MAKTDQRPKADRWCALAAAAAGVLGGVPTGMVIRDIAAARAQFPPSDALNPLTLDRAELPNNVPDFSVENSSFPTISIGESGRWSSLLHERLNRHGFALPVCGAFDSETVRAVQIFQGTKGIRPTGIVDTLTWKALVPEQADNLPCFGTPSDGLSYHINRSCYPLSLEAQMLSVLTAGCNAVAPGDQDFLDVMKFVLKWEGGFRVDHAGDTKFGITQPYYADYLKANKIDPLRATPIRNLTMQQALAIYYSSTWLGVHCPQILELYRNSPIKNVLNPEHSDTSGLVLVISNGSINYGQNRANKFLRSAINLCSVPGLSKVSERRLSRTDLGGKDPNQDVLDAIGVCVELGLISSITKEILRLERAHYDRLGLQPTHKDDYQGWLNRHADLRGILGVSPVHTKHEPICNYRSRF